MKCIEISACSEHLEKPQMVDIDAQDPTRHLESVNPYAYKQESDVPPHAEYYAPIIVGDETTPPHTPVGLHQLPLGGGQYSPPKDKSKRRKLGSPEGAQYMLAREPTIIIESNGEDNEGEVQYEFIQVPPAHVESKTLQPGDLGGIEHTQSGGLAHIQQTIYPTSTQPGPSTQPADVEMGDNLQYMKKRWDLFEANPLTYELGFINNFLEMSPWENQIDVVDMALGGSLQLVHNTDYFGGALHNIAALGTRALGNYKAAKALYTLADYIKDFQRAIPKYVWDRMIEAYYPLEAAAKANESAAYKVADKPSSSAHKRVAKSPLGEGGRAYRTVAPTVGKIPVMQGPTKASGGWRVPPPVAPPYVAAHRARMGYRPRYRQYAPRQQTPSLLGAPQQEQAQATHTYPTITQTPPYAQHTAYTPLPQPPPASAFPTVITAADASIKPTKSRGDGLRLWPLSICILPAPHGPCTGTSTHAGAHSSPTTSTTTQSIGGILVTTHHTVI